MFWSVHYVLNCDLWIHWTSRRLPEVLKLRKQQKEAQLKPDKRQRQENEKPSEVVEEIVTEKVADDVVNEDSK